MTDPYNRDSIDATGINEVDRLFKELERSPFQQEHMPGTVQGEMSPSAAQDLGLIEINEAIASGTGVGGGIANPYFEAGPGDETVAIDSSEYNFLPYWPETTVAGTFTSTWGAEANGPSGYGVEISSDSGSASDEYYFEQEIDVDLYRPLCVTVGHEGSDANMMLKVAVQFLDAAGADVGSELSATFTTTSLAIDRFWRIPPALARTARIRVGAIASGVYAATQTRTILFITSEQPWTYSVNIPGVLSYASPATTTEYAMPFPSDIIPGGVYIADTPGFVMGISAKTSDTIAAGTATVSAVNETQATEPGPTVALSNGALSGVNRQSLDGLSGYDFEAGDELHLKLSADGSYSSTGGADYFAVARLLLVVSDSGDW